MVRATDGCGKTDDPRPVNRRKYEENYVRIFGIKCPLGHCSPLCVYKNKSCKDGMIQSLDIYEKFIRKLGIK